MVTRCQHSNEIGRKELYPLFYEEGNSATAATSHIALRDNAVLCNIASTISTSRSITLSEFNAMLKNVPQCINCVHDLMAQATYYLRNAEHKCPETAAIYLATAYNKCPTEVGTTFTKVRKLLISALNECKPSCHEKLADYFKRYENKYISDYLTDSKHFIDRFMEGFQDFSIEDRVEILIECIRRGEQEALKASQKDVVVLLGDTGVGKSTLINYLHGCALFLGNAKNLGIVDCISRNVIAVSEKSEKKEIAAIGHAQKSETFFPKVICDEESKLSFLDCPGFSDNRGLEVSLANACNIKNVLNASKSVKILVLVKAADLVDKKFNLINKIKHSLGSKENITQFKNSLLLVITHLEEATTRKPSASLEELEEIIRSKIQAEDPDLVELAKQFFIYDPLDQGENLEYRGSIGRDAILEKIKTLPSIDTPNIFHTILCAEDEKSLRELIEVMDRKIHNLIEKKDYPRAVFYFNVIKKLQVIENEYIYQIIDDFNNKINVNFSKRQEKVSQILVNQEFLEAKELIEDFKPGLILLKETGYPSNIQQLEKKCVEQRENFVAKIQRIRELDTQEYVALGTWKEGCQDGVGRKLERTKAYTFPVAIQDSKITSNGEFEISPQLQEGNKKIYFKARKKGIKKGPFEVTVNIRAKKCDIYREEIEKINQELGEYTKYWSSERKECINEAATWIHQALQKTQNT